MQLMQLLMKHIGALAVLAALLVPADSTYDVVDLLQSDLTRQRTTLPELALKLLEAKEQCLQSSTDCLPILKQARARWARWARCWWPPGFISPTPKRVAERPLLAWRLMSPVTSAHPSGERCTSRGGTWWDYQHLDFQESVAAISLVKATYSSCLPLGLTKQLPAFVNEEIHCWELTISLDVSRLFPSLIPTGSLPLLVLSLSKNATAASFAPVDLPADPASSVAIRARSVGFGLRGLRAH